MNAQSTSELLVPKRVRYPSPLGTNGEISIPSSAIRNIEHRGVELEYNVPIVTFHLQVGLDEWADLIIPESAYNALQQGADMRFIHNTPQDVLTTTQSGNYR